MEPDARTIDPRTFPAGHGSLCHRRDGDHGDVDGDDVRGMTANAFMSGSLEPPLCVVSVAKRAHMHGHLESGRPLRREHPGDGQEDFATHFAGRPIPALEVRFADVDGVPMLAEASARIVADIARAHDCGDHTIFIGHILYMTPTTARRFSTTPAATPIWSRRTARALPHPEFW